jgi:hypothetical protein
MFNVRASSEQSEETQEDQPSYLTTAHPSAHVLEALYARPGMSKPCKKPLPAGDGAVAPLLEPFIKHLLINYRFCAQAGAVAQPLFTLPLMHFRIQRRYAQRPTASWNCAALGLDVQYERSDFGAA